MIIVAIAGPVTNLFLATLAALGLRFGHHLPPSVQDWVLRNLLNALSLNVLLAVFNMLPILPLDGGRVLLGLLPRPLASAFARLEPYGMPILIGPPVYLASSRRAARTKSRRALMDGCGPEQRSSRIPGPGYDRLLIEQQADNLQHSHGECCRWPAPLRGLPPESESRALGDRLNEPIRHSVECCFFFRQGEGGHAPSVHHLLRCRGSDEYLVGPLRCSGVLNARRSRLIARHTAAK